MKYKILRTDQEIDKILNRCFNQEDKGSSVYPEKTYENGIVEVINWLIQTNPDPLFE